MMPIALSIAGADPSGGAGIQADLKTFHQRGVYGTSVITVLTVQNTRGLQEVIPVEPHVVLDQLEAVLVDLTPQAIKLGALGNSQIMNALAGRLCEAKQPLVIDPVMMSKNKTPLILPEAVETLKLKLLPLATLVTPNLHEAEVLSGTRICDVESMEQAAQKICDLGAKAVLVKGGHLEGDAIDVLVRPNGKQIYRQRRVETVHTHGTGCTFSAAITAELAKGVNLEAAIEVAKKFITKAILTNPGLGQGIGPVNHHAKID